MAEVGDDRDGLRLDVVPVQLGPFFPPFPAGLVLNVRFAGDIVLDVEVAAASLIGAEPRRLGRTASPFVQALSERVPVAELELARARDHLRWLADALMAQELMALGLRVLRLAHDVRAGEGERVRRFAQRLSWTQIFRWSLPRSASEQQIVDGLGLGPVSRAAGLDEDVRHDDPTYRDLGFEPIVLRGNDAESRWRLRLAEAERSLDLARAAGSRTTQLVGRVESPRGRLEPGDAPSQRLLQLVPGLLGGLEWGDAVAQLVSLDLDLDGAGDAQTLHREAAA